MAVQNETGRIGEEVAVHFLEHQGYTVLHTNWRYRRFELDIIALTDKELVIVEVKTRSENYLLPPETAIDENKIRRIVATTDAYINKFEIDKPIRFDVICVIKKATVYSIEQHLENAFFAPIE